MEFESIIKFIMFAAVIVWYIYSTFKKSQAKAAAKTRPIEQTRQTIAPKKTAESRPIDDVLKDLFGLPEIETPKTPPPKPRPVIKVKNTSLKEKRLEMKSKTPPRRKKTAPKSTKQPSIKRPDKNLLTFSSNPLAQAIILSDVLGPAKSQRDDSLI